MQQFAILIHNRDFGVYHGLFLLKYLFVKKYNIFVACSCSSWKLFLVTCTSDSFERKDENKSRY